MARGEWSSSHLSIYRCGPSSMHRSVAAQNVPSANLSMILRRGILVLHTLRLSLKSLYTKYLQKTLNGPVTNFYSPSEGLKMTNINVLRLMRNNKPAATSIYRSTRTSTRRALIRTHANHIGGRRLLPSTSPRFLLTFSSRCPVSDRHNFRSHTFKREKAILPVPDGSLVPWKKRLR